MIHLYKIKIFVNVNIYYFSLYTHGVSIVFELKIVEVPKWSFFYKDFDLNTTVVYLLPK